MKESNELICPSCSSKLRMERKPAWTTGIVRCPACGKRFTVNLEEKVTGKTA